MAQLVKSIERACRSSPLVSKWINSPENDDASLLDSAA
jgi:hypothetical protein